MEIPRLPVDAVVMAGRLRPDLGKSTMSMICTGGVSRVYQNVKYANGDHQVHPTAIPGADKLRL
jgi:hypothetical protein